MRTVVNGAHVKRRRVATGNVIDLDPLAGLEHLRAAALVGYDALAEATAEPIAWVWHEIIAADHAVEFSGRSGVGKTTFVFMLIAAIANPTGKPISLLGREVTPAPPGRYVVVVQSENGVHSTAGKLEVVCAILGLPVKETIDRCILLVRKNVKAHVVNGDTRETIWSDIMELGRRGLIAAVILDSRARVLRGGESASEDDQSEMAEVIADLITASGAPVIVISHTRKSGAESIEDIAGSNQRGAGADVVLLFNGDRDKKSMKVLATRIIFAKLRDGLGEHPDPVSYSLARDASGQWRMAMDASAQSEDRPAHERLFDLLIERGPMTTTAIRTAMRVNGPTVQRCITTLFAEKRITKAKTKKNGRTFEVFAARKESAPLPSFAALLEDPTDV